jgi:protein-disulfide isomerase
MGFGWFLSAYLLLRELALRHGLLSGALDSSANRFCSGCDETLAGLSSSLFGVPLAGWGLVYFAVVGLLLVLENGWSQRAAVLGTALGSGASIALTVSLLSSGDAVCLLCILVHAVNLALLGSLWAPMTEGSAFSKRKAPVILASIAAGGLLLAIASGMTSNTAEVLAAYLSSPRHDIAIQSDDAVLGPADAPARIVVFSSFQCPGCASFAKMTRRLNAHFAGKVSITFKHYPLSTACNPALKFDLQPRSCAAAAAAEAANRQQTFWPYHDALFASPPTGSEELLADLAGSLRLDLLRWDSDRHSDIVQNRIVADIELGRRLGVDGTPAVFLNGRRVRVFSLPVLKMLVRQQIGDSH